MFSARPHRLPEEAAFVIHGIKLKLNARDKADEGKKRLKDRIRKVVERMKRDPGKVRGQVKAKNFGFSTSTDSSGA